MTESGRDKYVQSSEAVRLLGVKRETLYAYVSRGVLRSFRRGMSRTRLYLRREIEALRTIQPSRAPRTPEYSIPWAKDWIGDK